jgi:hypothetical protein
MWFPGIKTFNGFPLIRNNSESITNVKIAIADTVGCHPNDVCLSPNMFTVSYIGLPPQYTLQTFKAVGHKRQFVVLVEGDYI